MDGNTSGITTDGNRDCCVVVSCMLGSVTADAFEAMEKMKDISANHRRLDSDFQEILNDNFMELI